jgi:uncharacterized RDD family membrane protein YckC
MNQGFAMTVTTLPDPVTAPDLFDGVLTRRVFAWLLDFFLIAVLTGVLALIGLLMGFLTFGLAWLGLPLAFPAAALLYYFVTLGIGAAATPGMALMDLRLTSTSEAPLNAGRRLAHPLLFWIGMWICWPVSLAIALFTPRRQMLHDLVLGMLMVRRGPNVSAS